MSYYNTKQFIWFEKERSFIAEASDFGPNGLQHTQIFNDSCDLGFTLVSERTGKEVKVYRSETHRDREGDVWYWTYLPVDNNHNFKVTIFND